MLEFSAFIAFEVLVKHTLNENKSEFNGTKLVFCIRN